MIDFNILDKGERSGLEPGNLVAQAQGNKVTLSANCSAAQMMTIASVIIDQLSPLDFLVFIKTWNRFQEKKGMESRRLNADSEELQRLRMENENLRYALNSLSKEDK